MVKKSNQEPDNELRRRADRLRSGVEQARRQLPEGPSAEYDVVARALDEMSRLLDDALKPGGPTRDRLGLVLRVEAELCLYQARQTLIADHIRLKDRLYRLSEGSKSAWLAELSRFEKGKSFDEHEYRQILRRLTYEVAEAAESYERLAKQRSDALLKLMGGAFAIVFCLIVLFLTQLFAVLDATRGQPNPVAFLRSFPQPLVIMVLFAGSLGAAVTVVRSLLTEEKVRPDYVPALLVNLLIRVAFGALYAITVIFALHAEILPLRPSTENGLLMFFVVAAVAAGVSDQLFGLAISGVITGNRDRTSVKSQKA